MEEIRRKDRAISEKESEAMLEMCEYGTLAMASPDNTPYQTPVNYVYDRGEKAVYIHGAKEGKKITLIAANPNVCFSVVGGCKVIEGFTTLYSSILAYGTAAVLEDEEQKEAALVKLCAKYYPEVPTEDILGYVRKDLSCTAVIKVTISKITGKANKKGYE